MSKAKATNFEIEKIDEKKLPQTKTDTIFETNKFMKVFKWFIPTLVVFVLLMINYAIKGIAPFGSKYISYIDMEVGYVPVFYSMWDMVRGGGNLFYNFFLGMGSNVYGSLVMNAMFSPLNWLVILVPRGAISAFLSWLLIIKLSLMATTMLYFIRKVFKNTNTYLQLLYSIMWAFSGYVFVHFTNIIWLDNIIIFPFICLGIKRIFDQNKMDLYLWTLTASLLFSFYISFMILLMVIFCGGTAVYFSGRSKEDKKKITTKLVIATFLALFISFLSLLPAFWQSWTSYRISGQKKDILYENTFSKAVTILMSSFALYGFFRLLTKYKEDKKNILMFIVMAGFTTITILLERANMLWHTGSYQSFPYRFAFVPIFIIMCGGLYYFDRFYAEDSQKLAQNPKKTNWSTFLLIIPIVVGAAIISIGVEYPAFPVSFTQFLVYLLIASLVVLFLFQLFNYNNKKLLYIFVPIVCFVEVFSGILGYVGQWTVNPVNTACDNYNAIYENMELPDNDYRYATYFAKPSNYYMTKYYNYPYIIRRTSVSNWLHIISAEQAKYAAQMGYTSRKTSITSSGANYFVNMTNNTRYVLTDKVLSSEVYNYVAEYNGFYVYEYKYYLPLGGIYDKTNLIESIPEEYQNFAASNYLYNNMFGKSGDLFETLTFTTEDYDEDSVVIKVTAPANSLVYLNNTEDADEECNLHLNGVLTNFYVGNLELGYFDGETIELVVKKELEDFYKTFTFAAVNVDKLKDLAENNNIGNNDYVSFSGTHIKTTVNGTEGKGILIPVNYNSGWKAYINGKEVKVNRALGTFMSLDLQDGENAIEMKFSVPMLKIGLIVTLASLLLLLVLWLVNKFTKFVESKIFNNIFYWVGVVGFVIAGLVVYVRPLVQTIIYLG